MNSAHAPSRPYALHVMRCDGTSRQFELAPGKGLFLGHDSRCGVQLFGKDLPNIVCRIELEGEQVWIQNWMANDLVTINGQLVSDRVEMKSSDLLEIPDYRIRWSFGSHSTTDPSEFPSSTTVAGHISEVQEPITDPPPPPIDLDSQLRGMESTPTIESPDVTPADLDSCGSDSDSAPLQSRAFGETSPQDAPLNEAVDAHPTEAVASQDDIIDDDWFNLDDDDPDSAPESFDHETVALLQSEIESLRAELADARCNRQASESVNSSSDEDDDAVRQRIEQLVDEASKSDERVAILEEMLLAAEQANQSEQEERQQLEAWMSDIEKRLSAREDEQRAEVESLQRRLREANQGRDRFVSKLRAIADGSRIDAETIEKAFEDLQDRAEKLEEKVAESEREKARLVHQLEESKAGVEIALREERAQLAREQAKLARTRFELSNQISQAESLPKNDNAEDRELALKMKTLREHLREIHEQEKEEIQQTSGLASKIASLWRRTEY